MLCSHGLETRPDDRSVLVGNGLLMTRVVVAVIFNTFASHRSDTRQDLWLTFSPRLLGLSEASLTSVWNIDRCFYVQTCVLGIRVTEMNQMLCKSSQSDAM